ncbi:S-layer homology domain-containing protein [Peptoniphilus asaccharolyticus]|uniref:S-layer homology domain-containing protein n=1 Tax=Peptoniphilus asaccharolyticus TaxID=1258 RepID=UPI001932A50A|nr:S-layer homology domain-containing protein [Peptoniphilus asaccharolyticus]MBL7574279.1 S-layer homology domain-containing protein [Peptoniphilus asaccharolyticus]
MSDITNFRTRKNQIAKSLKKLILYLLVISLVLPSLTEVAWAAANPPEAMLKDNQARAGEAPWKPDDYENGSDAAVMARTGFCGNVGDLLFRGSVKGIHYTQWKDPYDEFGWSMKPGGNDNYADELIRVNAKFDKETNTIHWKIIVKGQSAGPLMGVTKDLTNPYFYIAISRGLESPRNLYVSNGFRKLKEYPDNWHALHTGNFQMYDVTKGSNSILYNGRRILGKTDQTKEFLQEKYRLPCTGDNKDSSMDYNIEKYNYYSKYAIRDNQSGFNEANTRMYSFTTELDIGEVVANAELPNVDSDFTNYMGWGGKRNDVDLSGKVWVTVGATSRELGVNKAKPHGTGNYNFSKIAVVDVMPNEDKLNLKPYYNEEKGKPGDTVKLPIKFEDNKKFPEGTRFMLESDPKDEFNVDPSTGEITQKPATKTGPKSINEYTGEVTVKIPKNAKDGEKITDKVHVIYPDGSKRIVPFVVKVIEDTTAKKVTELGGLSPETIKVWVNDPITWSKGVKATKGENKDEVAKLLKDAKVTDKTQPERTSAVAGEKQGTLLVTFKDNSKLEVANQMLIVSNEKVVDPEDPNKLPDDKIKVEFAKGTGVTNVAAKNLYVKPNTTLVDADFPQATLENGYKNLTWTPADKKVTTTNKKFTATATPKTTAEKIEGLGGIEGKDLAAWVGDKLDSDFWKKGVEAKSTDTTVKAVVKVAIQAAKKVEDTTTPARTTAAEVLNPTDGKLKITFADDSTLEVTQKLYVYENGAQKPEGGKPVPTDAATVTFTKDNESIKADGWDAVKPIIVKKGTAVPEGKFPNAEAKEGYKSVTWTPAKDTVVNADQAFNAKAEKIDYTTDKIIPWVPGTDKEPDKGSDDKPIPTDYITVTFQAQKEGTTALGKVKVGTKEGAEVKAKVKPGTNLSTLKVEGKEEALIKAIPNEGYGFTVWAPELGVAQADKPYVAKFIKDGSEVQPKDPIPTGWHRVTVKQDATIVAGTVTEKTYAVKDKLSKDKLVDLTGKAVDKHENPAWYDGKTNLGAKPTQDVAVSADKTILAKATAEKDTTTDKIIPWVPGTDKEPDKGSDDKPIPTDYITVTFQAQKEGTTALGKVKVGTKEGAEVKAKVKPGTNLSTLKVEGKEEALIKAIPNEGYGFTVWAPELGVAQADKPYVAKFIKDGSEVQPKDPIPTGWHRVTVKQDATIVAGTVTEKTYAVKDKLSKDKLVDLTGKAVDKHENPAWYDGKTNLGAKPTQDVAVSADKTILAKATAEKDTTTDKIIPWVPQDPKNPEKDKPTEGSDKKPIPDTYVTVTFESEDEAKGEIKIGEKQGKKVWAKVAPETLYKDIKEKVSVVGKAGNELKNWTPAEKITDTYKMVANDAYTAHFIKKGVEDAASKLKDKLDPQDINVWKDYPVKDINWKDGVKLKEGTEDTGGKLQELIDKATVTDESKRDTSAVGKHPGTLKVAFEDGSELNVVKQNLVVKDHILPDNDENAPNDAIKVKFLLGEGVKVVKEGVTTEGIKETPVLYKTYKIKPGTNLGEYKHSVLKETIFKLINAEVLDDTYKDVAWKGKVTNDPTNYVVSQDNNEFTAYAKKASDKDIIPYIPDDQNNPTNPDDKNVPKEDTDGKPIKKDDYIIVSFKIEKPRAATLVLDGKKGKVISALVKKTNPIRKWSELTLPTIGQTMDQNNQYTFEKWVDASKAEMTADKQLEDKAVYTATFKTNDGFDKDAIIGFNFIKDPTKMEYNEGEKPNHDGLKIELVDKNNNKVTVTKDKLEEYGITIEPKEDTALTKEDDGKHLVAKITTKDGDGQDKELTASSPGTLTVNQKPVQDKSTTPTINQPTVGDEKIKGKGVVGATIVVKDGNGNEIGTATVDQNGDWEVTVPAAEPLQKDEIIKATQTETGKDPSEPASTTVKDKEDTTANPTINQPYEGDDKITGKGEPGSDIVVKDKDGNEIGKTKVDDNGNWTVDVPADKPLKQGDTIKVTQTDGNGKTKDAETTVKGKEDTTANPTINQPYEGDDKITGKGEPGSDIVVKDKDGNEIGKTKVDDNGNWTVDVPADKPLKQGDTIKVTQTDGNGKTKDAETTVKGKTTPTPEPTPEPQPTPDYNPWWPIYFGSTKIEAKPEPKSLERHEAYISGYPDGTVRPDGKITRAEVSTIFARLTENSAPANYSPKFSDVLAYDWFSDSVMKLSKKDIIKGYPDGTFKPNKSITRAEFATIVSKYIKNPKAADETFVDVPMNHWAKDAIAKVKAEGLISGYPDGTFKPDAPITRAEAVSIVNRMFDRAADGEFVREHRFEIKSFKDLVENHWAYYEIIEAVHTHDYERIGTRVEKWDKIVK